MIKVNDNFCKLPGSYLFAEIARRVSTFGAAHPDGPRLIRMGIGDVTLPICAEAVEAMAKAVDELAGQSTFRGYGPEAGYDFLRQAIAEVDYRQRGIDLSIDEIFVSDGAKSDTGNIGDILSPDCRIAITDPVYPVYVDTNVMAGRGGDLDSAGRWTGLTYLPCTTDNGFIPVLPAEAPDVVYLCYPNNPTGTTLTRQQLKGWVDYARREKVLILFDAAYEAYITEPDVPHSIYEIPGAKEVAIEFRSYSKTAGFTGVRCGYTVVPNELTGIGGDGTAVSLNRLWKRRQSTKFNGASYISQCGAAALYTDAGRRSVAESVGYYMSNANAIARSLSRLGLDVTGGVNAPYVWVKTPGGMTSWDFFDRLLNRCRIVVTPGSGFGPSGEGYVRFSAFSTAEATAEAMKRIENITL